jgi:hypothetical protein
MADNGGSGGISFLAFVVGGLVVIVGLFALLVWGGDFSTGGTKAPDVNIQVPTPAPKPGG